MKRSTDRRIEVMYSGKYAEAHPPRPVKLEIPGFAGQPDERAMTGEMSKSAQPWNCQSFTDVINRSIEICWPIQQEVLIFNNGSGGITTRGNFELYTKSPGTISSFAKNHYGINTSLQLQMTPGRGGLILPHPRWFADPFNSHLPAIVPGIIEFDWWPRCFFVVATVPQIYPGIPAKDCFARLIPGEPFCQVIPIDIRSVPSLRRADYQESTELNRRDRICDKGYKQLSTVNWTSATGKDFGDIYKILSKEFAENGKIDWKAAAIKAGLEKL